jgi:hypothetical protein
MTFQVAACNDVHVILMTGDKESENYYLIALGGCGNKKSINKNEIVAKHDGPILHCTENRKFWINWDSSMINVGHGTIINKNNFLSFESSSVLLDIVDIGVRTEFGAKGKWLFYHEGGIILCYHFLSSINFWGHSARGRMVVGFATTCAIRS